LKLAALALKALREPFHSATTTAETLLSSNFIACSVPPPRVIATTPLRDLDLAGLARWR